MMEATDSFAAQALRVASPRVRGFDRPLTCILGLPFDAIGASEAVERIRDAAFSGERCFVSTPNLNFAMAARVDARFRDSVLRSDLSLVDGMPLVWFARLTGTPLQERVSGADVFEALMAHGGPPISVYLFGGPPGAAALASEAINRSGGGVRCVGFDTAGFGSVESMSDDERIDRINRSGAQFVVVSLGAGKGQAWIEHNAPRLTAPVLSHLGAVVNFAAGTVRRAPPWMRPFGLEWLWRIREEPFLWRRYWKDGLGAVRLVATRVLPDALAVRWWRVYARRHAPTPLLEHQRTAGGHCLRLRGDWRRNDGLEALRGALRHCAAEPAHLSIDLSAAVGMGSAVTALLLVAHGRFAEVAGIDFHGASHTLRAALRRQMAADALLGDRA
jgi:N-acetylglucosaminyldiphosphoundecaprenol N-acetyl-beta-D-mannosaminyltransferase